MKIRNIPILLSLIVLIFSTLACWRTNRPALEFNPEALPEASVGVVYDVEIQVSKNETPVYQFYVSEGALPRGLIFEYIEYEDKARIHGVPEEAGSFTFLVTAACLGTNVNGQVGMQEYTLVVK